MNKDKLDFSSAPNAKTLWDKGFRPVLKPRHTIDHIRPEAIDSTISLAAFDMNAGTGGAAVYLWLRRDPLEAAVTELAISHCEAEVEEFKKMGFEMLPQNVNEQSKSTSVVNVWYKKGTGPAITDVMLVDQAIDSEAWCNSTKMGTPGIHICGAPTIPATQPYKTCGGYSLVSGNLNHGPGHVLSGRGAFMYVKHAPDAHLRRVLKWTPEKAGHYIFCYAGAEPDHPEMSSTQRCIDLDIKVDPAPLFDALQPLSTYMGKVLEFTISYVDINHPHEKVHISMVQTMPMLTGFKMVGNPTVTVLDAHGHAYSGDQPQRMARTAQVVQWFPDATYGGYKDDVCFNGTDADGSALRHAHSKIGCVNIFVERCQWYVQTEDTLIQVAARFATNWLQVWHFNPTLLHPDSALPPESLINIGHLYEVEPNDAMAVLAERFGTKVEHIQQNNWDLARGTTLPLSKSICIIPNSCVTAAHVQRDSIAA